MPPRGSAQDQVLRAVIRREREEKFAVVRHFSYLLSAAFRLDPDAVQEQLNRYYAEVTQSRYDPPIIGAELRRVKKALRKKKQDAKLLERVESYTVDDSELPPVKGTRRRR